MKHLSLILLSLMLPALAQAVDCNAYMPSETGTVMEQTMYNKKGKALGKNVMELVLVEQKDKETHFKVHQKSLDKKGNITFETDLGYKCVDDIFYIDMSSFMSGEAMGAYGEMDLTVTMDEIDIPVNAQPGQMLKDGNLQMKIGGMPMNMTIKVDVINRKVEAVESITTPAGTFDCVKISQDVVTKMMMTVKAHSVDWYAKGVGVVRTESYNKKGKLTGYTELTRLEKP